MPRIGALAATLLVSLFSGEAAHAQPRRAPPAEILISQGTTMCVLELAHLDRPGADERDCVADAYLPPGTVIDRVPNRHAPVAVLVTTRFGLAGRMKRGSIFWTGDQLADFQKAGTVAFITRNAVAGGIASPNGPCTLTRGEWLPVLPADRAVDGELTLQLRDPRHQCATTGALRAVTFPTDNLTTTRFSGATVEQLNEEGHPIHVDHFRPFVFANLTSFQKKCGVEITETGKASGKIGFDVGKLIDTLVKGLPVVAQASAEQQLTRTFTSPKTLWEDKKFYTSDGRVIEITKRKQCEETAGVFREPPEFWYYVGTGPQSADLDSDRLREIGVRMSAGTNRATISCADDYLKLADGLHSWEFPDRAIPFLISRVASIRRFGRDCARS